MLSPDDAQDVAPRLAAQLPPLLAWLEQHSALEALDRALNYDENTPPLELPSSGDWRSPEDWYAGLIAAHLRGRDLTALVERRRSQAWRAPIRKELDLLVERLRGARSTS